ncbi:ketosynthase chain-length factor [Winogradskya humida]|uniref:Actinorhodin polyketide beta-ketoacyl synthase n=1 Tax=Winogradskya humida TaxID=113566 RepID=A0ABQ4A080_9ACTN|nr:ketosynthase chain-length factor [Actinoplanes humidus]GIE24285.1 actinorhodin polyketide beta-ketoacyl synthase [Actinoplanes humidus]
MTATITGLGIVAPNGVGADVYWPATLTGRSGLSRLPEGHAVRVGGVVSGERAAGVPGRIAVQTDRWTQLALRGSALALADAGLDPAELGPFDLGVVTAASSGGNEFGQREIQKLWAQGPDHVGAYQSIAWFYAATTGQVSIRHQAKGPCGVLVSEQAAGLDALGQARRVLRDDTPVVISGGTEAPLSPYALLCQAGNGAISEGTDPGTAYLPFDRRAAGYVPGEGGAMIVLEDAGHARGRGARRYADLAGYAASFDPPPGSPRPPALTAAIRGALRDAGLGPADIDVVFADGAGTRDADRAEAEAIAAVFGAGEVPVTVPKTLTGRLYAGGASLDVATAALAIHHDLIPPTAGVTDVSPDCPIDLVRDLPRFGSVQCALVIARGAGGFNAAVVLTAPAG